MQGLTGSDDGVARLASKSETLIPKLLHLMGKPAAESKPAATALVNLTTALDIATLAVEKGAVERAMEFLRASPTPEDAPPTSSSPSSSTSPTPKAAFTSSPRRATSRGFVSEVSFVDDDPLEEITPRRASSTPTPATPPRRGPRVSSIRPGVSSAPCSRQ